jgi:hypothetical protein
MRRGIVGMWRTLVLLVSFGLAITLAMGTPALVAGSSIYEHYNTGDNGYAGIFGSLWPAQTFTPSAAHTITSVKLKLFRNGLPGTVTVSKRATSGGQPTGGDLCSGTTNGDTLTTSTSGEWREITLGGGYGLSAGTQYAIVARATGGDTSNMVIWLMDATAPTYGGGMWLYSLDSGSSWTSAAGYDLMFEEWGDPPGAGAVGWQTYPTNKVRVLLPWIILGAAIIAGATLLVLRRRRAQS